MKASASSGCPGLKPSEDKGLAAFSYFVSGICVLTSPSATIPAAWNGPFGRTRWQRPHSENPPASEEIVSANHCVYPPGHEQPPFASRTPWHREPARSPSPPLEESFVLEINTRRNPKERGASILMKVFSR